MVVAGTPTTGEEAIVRTLFPKTKIGMRLRSALPFWRRFIVNKTVLSWLEFGLTYEFTKGAPPPHDVTEYPLSARLSTVRDTEIKRYEDMGVVVPLPPEELDTAVFNGVFVVEQKNKLRPIIDQRFPNSFTEKVHFKMDSIRDVRDLIREHDFMFTIDFKDAYLHLFYKRHFWKYGAFWRPKLYGAFHSRRKPRSRTLRNTERKDRVNLYATQTPRKGSLRGVKARQTERNC